MLKVVGLVLRGVLSDDGSGDVAFIISDFLVEDFAVDQACQLGSVGSSALLEFVWSRGLRGLQSSSWMIAKLVHTEPHYYHWAFSRALVQAVKRGDLIIVEWLLDHFPGCRVTKDVGIEAARCGQLWLLQFLENDDRHGGMEWISSCVQEAAKAGHWELVRWLDERVSSPETRHADDRTLCFAIEQNDFEQVKWAVSMGFAGSQSFGHDDSVIEWTTRRQIWCYLLGSGRYEFLKAAVGEAIKMGDIASVLWLLQFIDDSDAQGVLQALNDMLAYASECGQLAIVQWLLDANHLLPHGPSDAMFAAARGGSLDVVRWLYDRYGGDSTIDLFRGRESGNELECIIPGTAFDVAACNGCLEVLQFLHQIDLSYQNGSVDNNTNKGSVVCTAAAMDGPALAGHVDVVKWLHFNRSEGCTTLAMDTVAGTYVYLNPGFHKRKLSFSERREFLQWLHVNRSEGCTFSAMNAAARKGNFNTLRWLYENTDSGCTFRAVDEAARLGRLDILMWLRGHCDAECTSHAFNNAASLGHLETLKWLHSNYPQVSMIHALGGTIRGSCHKQRQLRTIRWLLGHTPKGEILRTIRNAIFYNEFEITLFLHSQSPVYSNHEVPHIMRNFDHQLPHLPDTKDIRSWVSEQYPLHAADAG